eukprot:gene4654-3354_t
MRYIYIYICTGIKEHILSFLVVVVVVRFFHPPPPILLRTPPTTNIRLTRTEGAGGEQCVCLHAAGIWFVTERNKQTNSGASTATVCESANRRDLKRRRPPPLTGVEREREHTMDASYGIAQQQINKPNQTIPHSLTPPLLQCGRQESKERREVRDRGNSLSLPLSRSLHIVTLILIVTLASTPTTYCSLSLSLLFLYQSICISGPYSCVILTTTTRRRDSNNSRQTSRLLLLLFIFLFSASIIIIIIIIIIFVHPLSVSVTDNNSLKALFTLTNIYKRETFFFIPPPRGESEAQHDTRGLMADSREAMRRLLEETREKVRRRATDGSVAVPHRKTLGATAPKPNEGKKVISTNLLNAKDNAKEFVQYFYSLIKHFVEDKTKYELEMPKLDGFDRLVVHAIAEKCNLCHESKGSGERRVMSLRKDDLFFRHQEAVYHVDLDDIVSKVGAKESKFHVRRTYVKPSERRALAPGQLGSYADEEGYEKTQRLVRATDVYLHATSMGYTHEEMLAQSGGGADGHEASVAPYRTLEERLRGDGEEEMEEEERPAGAADVAPVRRRLADVAARLASPAPRAGSSTTASTTPTTTTTAATHAPAGAVGGSSVKRPVAHTEMCRTCRSRVPVPGDQLRTWRCDKYCATCAQPTIWKLEERPLDTATGVAPTLTGARRPREGDDHEASIPAFAPGSDREEIRRDDDDDDDDEELLLEDAMDLAAMNDFSPEDTNWLREFANSALQLVHRMQRHLESTSAAPPPPLGWYGKGLQDYLFFCIDYSDLLRLGVFRRYERACLRRAQPTACGDDAPPQRKRRMEDGHAANETGPSGDGDTEGREGPPTPTSALPVYVVVREHKSLGKSLHEILEEVLRQAYHISSSEKNLLMSVAGHAALALPNVSVYGAEASALCQLRPLTGCEGVLPDLDGQARQVDVDMEALQVLQQQYGLRHIFVAESLEEAVNKANTPTNATPTVQIFNGLLFIADLSLSLSFFFLTYIYIFIYLYISLAGRRYPYFCSDSDTTQHTYTALLLCSCSGVTSSHTHAQTPQKPTRSTRFPPLHQGGPITTTQKETKQKQNNIKKRNRQTRQEGEKALYFKHDDATCHCCGQAFRTGSIRSSRCCTQRALLHTLSRPHHSALCSLRRCASTAAPSKGRRSSSCPSSAASPADPQDQDVASAHPIVSSTAAAAPLKVIPTQEKAGKKRRSRKAAAAPTPPPAPAPFSITTTAPREAAETAPDPTTAAPTVRSKGENQCSATKRSTPPTPGVPLTEQMEQLKHSIVAISGTRSNTIQEARETPTTYPHATPPPPPPAFLSSSCSPETQASHPTSAALVPPPSTHRQAYEQMLLETYINPFNGKRLHVQSPTAVALAGIGFVRCTDNPLYVRWRPEVYVERLQSTVLLLQEKRLRRYQQQLTAYEKAAAQRKNGKKSKRRSKKAEANASDEGPAEGEAPAPPSPPPAATIQEAMDIVLRPFERRLRRREDQIGLGDPLTARHLTPSTSSWTNEVGALLRRSDALSAVPQRLEQLYADLTTSSVMPPKLDASTPESMPSRPPDDGAAAAAAGEEGGAQDGAKNNDAGGGPSADQPEDRDGSATLTLDQMNVLHLAEQGYSLFIGGSAGTGKTVLLRQIHKQMMRMGLRVAMTATTGVAAVQLGGCTFHHAFNAPVHINAAGGSGGGLLGLSAELWSRRWDQVALRAVDVVMVDEVSLLDSQTFDAFDMEARLARMSSRPFGGIQVIACGDFMQLSIGLQDALPAYLSTAFGCLMKVRLETPMRHRSGDPLLPLLQKVRRGEFDAESFALLDKPIPSETAGDTGTAAAAEGGGGERGTPTTFIFPRRRDAQSLNEAKLSELITMEKLFPPQRGPLRLSGRFTSSAFLEMHSGAGLPPRGRVLDAIREELTRLIHEQLAALQKEKQQEREEEAVTGTSAIPGAGDDPASPAPPVPPPTASPAVLFAAVGSLHTLLTDLDVVVMPAQATATPLSASRATSSTTFFLRIRFPDAAPATATGDGERASSNEPASSSSSGGGGDDDPTPPSPPTASGAAESGASPSTSYQFSHSTSNTRTRASLLQTLLTNDVWEALAAAVAHRVGARLITFFDEEPRSLIPLSVSMALADMTNNDIAQALAPLRLKLGCRVMVTRNLSRQVSNGSVGTVEAVADPDPSLFPQRYVTRSATGSAGATALGHALETECFDKLPIIRLLDGSVVQIPPIPTHIGGSPLTYYYGHDVYAMPLQLGYAFTVHKVQGLTLQGTVVLDCKHFFLTAPTSSTMDQLIVKNIRPDMVTVKANALEFSDSLMPASDALGLKPPPEVGRGAWVLTRHSFQQQQMPPPHQGPMSPLSTCTTPPL